ncbi:hypothetical protein AD933_00205 [Acetobacter malorum]|uniref:Uncharacterized protein n=1 Tax=Acetobacter malorum TaxID=178901 RepID=A0A149S8J0_9PROT|nr:hypothetical protein [Acetobacter malorum]KXV23057.1 hypothetical protein AD933_00205 [Acetobacter malorum]
MNNYVIIFVVFTGAFAFLVSCAARYKKETKLILDKAHHLSLMQESLRVVLAEKNCPDEVKHNLILMAAACQKKETAEVMIRELRKFTSRLSNTRKKGKEAEITNMPNSPHFQKNFGVCVVTSISMASLVTQGDTNIASEILGEMFGKEEKVGKFNVNARLPRTEKISLYGYDNIPDFGCLA